MKWKILKIIIQNEEGEEEYAGEENMRKWEKKWLRWNMKWMKIITNKNMGKKKI